MLGYFIHPHYIYIYMYIYMALYKEIPEILMLFVLFLKRALYVITEAEFSICNISALGQ